MLLNGTWKVKGCLENGEVTEFSGNVPGCVHTDMIKNGFIGDIFYRKNALEIQWIEKNDYTYYKCFTVEKVYENAYIEFDGLDTYCDVYLNGTKIGEAENMHLQYAFCADGVLKDGENMLEIRFYSPVNKVEGKPPLPGAFTTERLYTRRIQCTYSWDWVDRFVTMGIFRDVRLVFRKPNEIDNLYIVTKSINQYSAQMKLSVALRDFKLSLDEYIGIEIKDPNGKLCFSKKRAAVYENFSEYIDIVDPALWFPNGYGKQPLYTLTVTSGECVKSVKFGIRQITILQIEDEEGSKEQLICSELQKEDFLEKIDKNESTACFTVLVNGVKIMCKGGNWVPCEPFPSAETPEKISSLLTAGADAGVNMLRVWGGGIFERDEFYDECDRLGILVTQDFLMACGTYPEHESWFIEALSKEAESAALRLRNHACLAWWSGDNENAVMGYEDITDYPGYLSAAFGIEPVISKLDPERYFLPSSPYGGKVYCSATRGTTHNTFFLGDVFAYVRENDMKNYREYFSKHLYRFNAEQAALGLPFVSSLMNFMTEEDIFGEDTSVSQFHTKNNPALGDITLYQYIEMMTRKIFGDFTSGEDRVAKMQMLHCEWVRLTLENFRRNKWFSSGIVYWMYNDCWPAASGWSLLDYYAMPKPAYYEFKRSAKPVIASIDEKDGKLRVYICNDSLQNACGNAKLYVYDFVKDEELKTIGFAFSVPENSSECVYECDYGKISEMLSDTTVIICDIKSSLGDDSAFFIAERYQDLAVSYGGVRITEISEDSVTVTADCFTPYALIDVPYFLEDNCFMMKKGETRTIKIV